MSAPTFLNECIHIGLGKGSLVVVVVVVVMVAAVVELEGQLSNNGLWMYPKSHIGGGG